ncbi:RecX family transcriptional regulator [Propionibacteriaceae bacterium Y2011]
MTETPKAGTGTGAAPGQAEEHLLSVDAWQPPAHRPGLAELRQAIRTIESGDGEAPPGSVAAPDGSPGAAPDVGSADPWESPEAPATASRGVPGAAERTLSDAEEQERAREIVLRKLDVRNRSRWELAEALAQRDVPAGTSEAVLDRMTEVGLIDDASFAREWVHARQERKHLSRRMLLDELRRKGVTRELAEEATADVGETDEYEAAVDLVRRKLPSLDRHDLDVQRRRLAGMLERRGFTVGLIHRVLADTLDVVP